MADPFNRGDLVRCTCDRFPQAEDVLILERGSPLRLTDGSQQYRYSVLRRRSGFFAWVDHESLTLIEAGREDLIAVWQAEIDAIIARESDLDWIFSGDRDAAKLGGASLAALGKCMGIPDLWGTSGEGIEWQRNASRVRYASYPFVAHGDRQGWERWCAQERERDAAWQKTLGVRGRIPDAIWNETGMAGGSSIHRPDGSEHHIVPLVSAFLEDPAHQSGAWGIDGGWGGPPGPFYVRWSALGQWESIGFGRHKLEATDA